MYNSLKSLPETPYRIIEYLATQDEVIWKLLKYPTYDALSHDDLTMTEKLNLIWRNGDPQEDFSVFLTNLVEDAITESKCIFKLYTYHIDPKELYMAPVIFAFDFLYGGKMALVEGENGVPVSRGDLFTHHVLKVLNGADVDGIGNLAFLNDISRYSLMKSTIGNSKTFTGVTLYLTVKMGDAGKENACGG